jgi:hypothetical protein
MKITGSGPSAGTSQRRGISGPGRERAAAGFAERVGARPLANSGVAANTPTATLDAVLVAQEIAEPTEQRRSGIRHGDSLLAELRELQLGPVEGWVGEGMLRRLARLLDGLRPAIEDPTLAELLDQLELRAAVELAKLGRDPM